MMSFLTFLLSRAVPDVRVWKVEIVELATLQRDYCSDLEGGIINSVAWGSMYSLDVRPEPYVYWKRFKEIYPHWKQLAHKYKPSPYSVVIRKLCPEFPTKEALLSWLADVLNLSRGKRRLLYFMEGR